MSGSSRVTTHKNVWDDVPDPGSLSPPLPEGDPPPLGSPERVEYDKMVREYAGWLKARRLYLLASSLARLDSPLSREDVIVEISRAVRVLGSMVLAGEVAPRPLDALFDLF